LISCHFSTFIHSFIHFFFVVVFDIRQRSCLNSYQAHNSPVRALSINEDSDDVVSGSTDGDLKMWDLKSFEEQKSWKNLHAKPMNILKPSNFMVSV